MAHQHKHKCKQRPSAKRDTGGKRSVVTASSINTDNTKEVPFGTHIVVLGGKERQVFQIGDGEDAANRLYICKMTGVTYRTPLGEASVEAVRKTRARYNQNKPACVELSEGVFMRTPRRGSEANTNKWGHHEFPSLFVLCDGHKSSREYGNDPRAMLYTDSKKRKTLKKKKKKKKSESRRAAASPRLGKYIGEEATTKASPPTSTFGLADWLPPAPQKTAKNAWNNPTQVEAPCDVTEATALDAVQDKGSERDCGAWGDLNSAPVNGWQSPVGSEAATSVGSSSPAWSPLTQDVLDGWNIYSQEDNDAQTATTWGSPPAPASLPKSPVASEHSTWAPQPSGQLTCDSKVVVPFANALFDSHTPSMPICAIQRMCFDFDRAEQQIGNTVGWASFGQLPLSTRMELVFYFKFHRRCEELQEFNLTLSSFAHPKSSRALLLAMGYSKDDAIHIGYRIGSEFVKCDRCKSHKLATSFVPTQIKRHARGQSMWCIACCEHKRVRKRGCNKGNRFKSTAPEFFPTTSR